MPTPKEIYRVRQACIYQDDGRNCFILEYNGHATSLSVNCFFSLKKQFDQVDIVAVVEDSSAATDITIISPHSCDRFFALSPIELIEMKALFAGAKAMLDLNSILKERLDTAVLT